MVWAKFIFNEVNFGNKFNFAGGEPPRIYNTRNRNLLPLPRPNLNVLQNSIFYEGIKFFNSLPEDLRGLDRSANFEAKHKFFMLSSY